RRGKRNAGAGQRDAFAVEEAEFTTGEGDTIDDGTEAAGHTVARIVITRSEEEGGAEAQPVVVLREFDCSELCVDFIALVVAPDFVECVCDVGASNVPVAGPAEVVRVDAVGLHGADGCRSDEETVVVIVR